MTNRAQSPESLSRPNVTEVLRLLRERAERGEAESAATPVAREARYRSGMICIQ